MRLRLRKVEDDLREYRTRERINALARYDGAGPEQVMRGLLGGSVDE